MEGDHLSITHHDFDELVQDCSICSALAMEILQVCTKPSILFDCFFWGPFYTNMK